MKQFRVIENGKEVWVQPFGKPVKKFIATNSLHEYARNACYFQNLMEIIGEVTDDVDLVLTVTREKASMILHLSREQLKLAEDIKSALLKAFPDDIDQVELSKNELHIMDIFQHRD